MEKNKDKRIISVEVSDDLKEALRIEAFNRAITTSALIRQLLKETPSLKKILKDLESKKVKEEFKK